MHPALALLAAGLVLGTAWAGLAPPRVPLTAGLRAPTAAADVGVGESIGEFTIDDRWLPGPTGWFKFNFEAVADTTVTASGVWTHYHRPPAGSATMFDYPTVGFPVVRGRLSGGGPWLGVNHEGTSLGCCPTSVSRLVEEAQWGPFSDGDAFAVGESLEGGPHSLRAGERMSVAFAATQWEPMSELEIIIRADPPALRVVGPETGPDVHVVDLGQAAFRAGTNIHTGSHLVAGAPGHADLQFSADEQGVFFLVYTMDDEYRADLRVTLPNGTMLDNAPGTNVYGSMRGVAPPGTLRVELRDMRATAVLESLQNGGKNVMARALFADIPWPRTGHVVDLWPTP